MLFAAVFQVRHTRVRYAKKLGVSNYRALSWSHDAWALIAFIVLHLGAWFTMEIYRFMLGFWYFLISYSRSEGTGKNRMFCKCYFCVRAQ